MRGQPDKQPMIALWLDAYGAQQALGAKHPSQWLGIPLAVASLVGLLWSIPTPAAFRDSWALLNWGTVFLMATVVYYFILSINLAFGSLPFLVAAAALSAWLDGRLTPLWLIAGLGFTIAIAWQCAVSWSTSRRVNLFGRLQFLMLGPLWLLAAFYRRAGLPY